KHSKLAKLRLTWSCFRSALWLRKNRNSRRSRPRTNLVYRVQPAGLERERILHSDPSAIRGPTIRSFASTSSRRPKRPSQAGQGSRIKIRNRVRKHSLRSRYASQSRWSSTKSDLFIVANTTCVAPKVDDSPPVIGW